MLDDKINKAINESVANVDIEKTYHNENELSKIKESILFNDESKVALEKIINLHKNTNRNEKNGK